MPVRWQHPGVDVGQGEQELGTRVDLAVERTPAEQFVHDGAQTRLLRQRLQRGVTVADDLGGFHAAAWPLRLWPLAQTPSAVAPKTELLQAPQHGLARPAHTGLRQQAFDTQHAAASELIALFGGNGGTLTHGSVSLTAPRGGFPP